MQKTLFDIDCEALDIFFDHEMGKISSTAKAELPRDVAFKLFRGGGKLNTKSTSKLGFIAKLYVLWKALNKRWWIVIEDEERGMTPGQFMELRKAYRKRDYGLDQARALMASGSLVLANKELGNACSYLNQLSVSPAYNYLVKAKNTPTNKVDKSEQELAYIAKFITFYEGQKKNLVANMGLVMPEFYVLLCLYDGNEVSGNQIYQSRFKRAYQSSPGKIRLAFSTLQSRGFIIKHGRTRGATLQITASGKETIRQCLIKYAVNC